MAFVELLQEALTRDQISDLAQNVAVVSVDRKNAGSPKYFLNLVYADNGEVEWSMYRPGSIFDMKGKIMKNILPKVKDQLGNYTFASRDELESDFDTRSLRAIDMERPLRMASGPSQFAAEGVVGDTLKMGAKLLPAFALMFQIFASNPNAAPALKDDIRIALIDMQMSKNPNVLDSNAQKVVQLVSSLKGEQRERFAQMFKKAYQETKKKIQAN
jgi:hypothetical protein